MQDLRVILQRCLPTGLRLLVRAPKEFVLEEAEEVLAEVVVGAQCGLGEGRAVQVVLRVVVDWKREGEPETSKEMTWLTR